MKRSEQINEVEALKTSPLIFQQISKIMTEIEAVAKNNKNAQQGYNFRGIDDVYNELHPLLAKHSVFTAPEVLTYERSERPTKSGGTMMYSVMQIKFTFYATDGSCFPVVMIGEGSDAGDKSSNKAMAIAHKYALVQTFAIPTKDDKDSESYSPEFSQQRMPSLMGKSQEPQHAPTRRPHDSLTSQAITHQPGLQKNNSKSLANPSAKESNATAQAAQTKPETLATLREPASTASHDMQILRNAVTRRMDQLGWTTEKLALHTGNQFALQPQDLVPFQLRELLKDMDEELINAQQQTTAR